MKFDPALIRRSIATAFLLMCAGVVLIAAPLSAVQKSEPSRDQAALAEDQALLQKQLQRLRQTMEVLAGRFEAEGRTHAAKLLRDGIVHLDQRATEQGAKTLEELMSGSHSSIQVGKPVQAIETQEAIVKGLERLYAILTDRLGLEDLERSLAELREIKANLGELAESESKLRQATEKLQQSSKSESQKSLEAGIQSALREQRALLERAEREARASNVFDLEALERALDALIERQARDARVLEAWKPEERPTLEEAAPALDRAAEHSARAERLEQAANELTKAARTVRSPSGDLAETARELERSEARSERRERAAGDATAPKASESFKAAAETTKKSGTSASERAAAADEIEKSAAELARAAAAENETALEAQRAALESLKKLSDPKTAAGHVAEEVQKALAGSPAHDSPAAADAPSAAAPSAEERAAKAAEARRANEEAQRALSSGLDDLRQVKPALSSAQNDASAESQRLKRGLESLPQASSQSGSEASAKLEAAAEAQKNAAEQAGKDQAGDAAKAAAQAERALREARSALSAARKSAQQNAQKSASSEAAAIQKAQAELAHKVGEMSEQAAQSDLEQQAKNEAQKALDEAAAAMEKAAESLREGSSSSAAESQSSAMQSLQKAASSAQQGGALSKPADQKKAQELAAEQERIRQALLELAERNKKRDTAAPTPSLDEAQESAAGASKSLEQGDLEEAAPQEEETERQIRQSMKELAEEEEQYQELRQEELLFKITEEVKNLTDEHQREMQNTLEVDKQRKAGERVTHTQRLRLRKIAKAEEALGARAAKISQAILAEESVVFAEVLTQAERDLTRIGRDMGEVGEYQSGERVQALQQDVEQSLSWLFTALQNEKERRKQEQKGGSGTAKNEKVQDNRLVPDVAELKLLRQLEVALLDDLERAQVLYPELSADDPIDPLVLEDLARIANRHQRTSDLFQKFRERLNLPAPDADQE